MCLTGKQLIGLQTEVVGGELFRAVNPASGLPLEPPFNEATQSSIDTALQLAEKDFDLYRELSLTRRSEFLEMIATELVASEQAMVERAMQETGLPEGRLIGELGRTVNQLNLFARLVREGSFVDARIDRAIPQRTPAPKPDLRSMKIPLGPVVVFGASNFPFAFSVAGGDTASALAAGCPVVAKAHPAHPGTSELAARAILGAVRKCGLPEGTFSLIQGSGPETGAALVNHPSTRAVAFTGSLAGGRALFDLAAARPEPIPVYAEMGSVNPLFILPQAMQDCGEVIARGVVESVALGVGQFCTSPGLLFALAGADLDRFQNLLAQAFTKVDAATMLHRGIKDSFCQGVERLLTIDGVQPVYPPQALEECQIAPVFLKADVKTVLENREITGELFGPSLILVVCNSRDELLAAASTLSGQLTATIHAESPELPSYTDLFRLLECKVGRIVLNGFPTGVEVCPSLVHGGPYPATTDSRTTSVGSAAIERFLRPVCYQNLPQELLPAPLKNRNKYRIWRLVDGELTREGL